MRRHHLHVLLCPAHHSLGGRSHHLYICLWLQLRSTINLRVRADLTQGIQLHYNIIWSLKVLNLKCQPIPKTSKFYSIATLGCQPSISGPLVLKFGRRQIWLKIKIWNLLFSYILTVYLSFLGHICAHPKFACRAQWPPWWVAWGLGLLPHQQSDLFVTDTSWEDLLCKCTLKYTTTYSTSVSIARSSVYSG